MRFLLISRVLLLFFLLFLTSCTSQGDANQTIMPELNYLDASGKIVTQASIGKGYTLFFITLDNDESNFVVFNKLAEFERNEELQLNKVCLARQDEVCPSGWITIQDPRLRKYFQNNYQDGFLVLYQDKKLISVLTTSEKKGYEVRAELLLRGLFEVIKGYSDPREIIESRRPEEYIDTDGLFRNCEEYVDDSGYQYILVVLSPYHRCSNKQNIIKFFDSRLRALPSSSGVVLLDGVDNNTEIDTVIHNYRIITPIVLIPSQRLGEINNLVKSNYFYAINMLFIYKGGVFAEALYVYEDCSSLYGIL